MKLILIALVSVTVLGLGVVAKFEGLAHATVKAKQESAVIEHQPGSNVIRQERPEVAEHLPYMFLFQFVSAMDANEKVDMLTELRVKSQLSEADFEESILVARRYKEEAGEYDRQAKVIIDEVHRQYPPGRLPVGTGPPRPPQELLDLQDRRNNAALKYRDEAKVQIDNERFEEFINREIRPKIGPVTREAQ